MEPMTLKEIKEDIKDFGSVYYLPYYPKEDDYIRIVLYDIPFCIEKGHDEFCYQGYSKKSKRHLWYIARSDIENPDIYIEKGFKTYRKAIEEGLKKYKKELKMQLKNTECFEKEF